MKRQITTGPSLFCVTPAEAKSRLIIEHSDDDALIFDLIKESTSWAEKYMDRPVMEQIITYYFDSFCGPIKLYTADISAVVISYDDENNEEQTFTNYDADLVAYPSLLSSDAWPEIYDKPNAVRVEITAGHNSAGTVPAGIKTGILLMVGHLHNNREGSSDRKINEMPMGIESFLDMYRVIA